MAFKNIGELNTMTNNPVADTRHSIPMPIHRHRGRLLLSGISSFMH